MAVDAGTMAYRLSRLALSHCSLAPRLNVHMHMGSSGLDGEAENASSRSAGSSTRSCKVDFVTLTGESGALESDELELG